MSVTTVGVEPLGVKSNNSDLGSTAQTDKLACSGADVNAARDSLQCTVSFIHGIWLLTSYLTFTGPQQVCQGSLPEQSLQGAGP